VTLAVSSRPEQNQYSAIYRHEKVLHISYVVEIHVTHNPRIFAFPFIYDKCGGGGGGGGAHSSAEISWKSFCSRGETYQLLCRLGLLLLYMFSEHKTH